MKSREQKTKELEAGTELLEKSGGVIFADFSGVSTDRISELKKALKETGAVFKVVKKRLLRIAFKQKGLDFDPEQFESQVGTIFVPGELSDSAGSVYKFSKALEKEKISFNLLGAFDIANKNAISQEDIIAIAKLPSREILLAHVMGAFSAPLKAFMSIVDQLSKKAVSEGDEPRPEESGREGGVEEKEAPTTTEGGDGAPTPEGVGETTEEAKQETTESPEGEEKPENPPSQDAPVDEEKTVE